MFRGGTVMLLKSNTGRGEKSSPLKPKCRLICVAGIAALTSACSATPGDFETAALAPPATTGTTLGQRTLETDAARPIRLSAAPTSGSAPSAAAAQVGNAAPAAHTGLTGPRAKAQNLRLAGQKAKALRTLDRAANADTDVDLLKERGMLALELGQLEKAQTLLKKARDGGDPDWRVLSALGAAYSARGNQQAAQIEFSKALKLAPDHPSILNNLALSYALDGNHDQAETLLRKVATTGKNRAKTSQNLALILGLNGKISEATKVSQSVLPAQKAQANAAFFASRQSQAKPVRVSKAATATSAPVRSAQVARK